jgi:kynurenine formamidase
MSLADRTPPTDEEYEAYRERFNNWGRWGVDDALGTLNHITPEVRRHALTLPQQGRTISLSLAISGDARSSMASGFEQEMRVSPMGSGDRISVNFHGWTVTHLDALCHIFTEPGGQIYNDRPSSDVTLDGAASGSVEPYQDGIVTRGVLYDVPRHRGVDFVTIEEPVHGWELADIAKAQGVDPRPGDAVVVRSGANAFYASRPDFAMGMFDEMPGVHGSALEFLYEQDAALLVWDLLDAGRQGYGHGLAGPDGATISIPIHEIAIPQMGMPLVDNANLDDLADACAEAGRAEFLLMVAPLRVRGGTGSPVNPIAVI